MDTMDLGAVIRLKRREKGLKQKDLAALLHVSAVSVSKWENGINFPDFGNLQALSAVLEIPMSDLLEGFPQSPKPEPDKNHVPSDSQSSFSSEDLALSGQVLPESSENPVPPPEGSLEPSDTVLPVAEDNAFWKKMKIAVPLLIFLFAGIIAVCWIRVGRRSKVPSFTVCDTYYGDYNDEHAYYVITEVESDPALEDLQNFNEIIREKYGEHFSVVDWIVIIYAEDYNDYIENGFNDNTDGRGVILPLPE